MPNSSSPPAIERPAPTEPARRRSYDTLATRQRIADAAVALLTERGFTALGINAVIWIDRLLGLRNPSMFSAIGSNPEGAPSYFTRSLVDAQGHAWQELDLQVLVAEPEFLAIAA